MSSNSAPQTECASLMRLIFTRRDPPPIIAKGFTRNHTQQQWLVIAFAVGGRARLPTTKKNNSCVLFHCHRGQFQIKILRGGGGYLLPFLVVLCHEVEHDWVCQMWRLVHRTVSGPGKLDEALRRGGITRRKTTGTDNMKNQQATVNVISHHRCGITG